MSTGGAPHQIGQRGRQVRVPPAGGHQVGLQPQRVEVLAGVEGRRQIGPVALAPCSTAERAADRAPPWRDRHDLQATAASTPDGRPGRGSAIANKPAASSCANGLGTASGRISLANRIQAHSKALRDTGAFHSAATFSCASARFTHRCAIDVTASEVHAPDV